MKEILTPVQTASIGPEYFSTKEEYGALKEELMDLQEKLRQMTEAKVKWDLQQLALLIVSCFDSVKELKAVVVTKNNVLASVDGVMSNDEQGKLERHIQSICSHLVAHRSVYFERQPHPENQLSANMQAALDEQSFAGWQKHMIEKALPKVLCSRNSPKAL